MANPIGVAEVIGGCNVRSYPSTANAPIGSLAKGVLVPVFNKVGERDTWLSINGNDSMWIAEIVDGIRYTKFYPFNDSTPVEKPPNVTEKMKEIQRKIEAGEPLTDSLVTTSGGFVNWIKANPLPAAGIGLGAAILGWYAFFKKR